MIDAPSSPRHRGVHCSTETRYCAGFHEFAFIAFSETRPLHSARWVLEIILEEQAQQVDAFSIGVYSVGVMGGVLNHEDCLFDVRRLRERNIAQYEPEALEIEDAPFDLALDLLTAMDDDFCIRRMCCVLHSERCLTEEAVRPGGGKRSRFGAVACVAANTEDPHDPVVGSHRGDEWISSTKVDMQIELEQRPFIGQANASPLVIHSAQVYDANLVRLGVAGSYDGISVRFMPEF
jgi:hypothetical protein